jgi:hypothetical protein
MILQDLKERFLAETPIFWKKVQRVSAGLATLGVTLVGIPVDNIPLIKSIGGYLIAVGSVVVAISQFTVNTKWDENK